MDPGCSVSLDVRDSWESGEGPVTVCALMGPVALN